MKLPLTTAVIGCIKTRTDQIALDNDSLVNLSHACRIKLLRRSDGITLENDSVTKAMHGWNITNYMKRRKNKTMEVNKWSACEKTESP